MKLGLPPVAASGDDFKTATAHEGLRETGPSTRGGCARLALDVAVADLGVSQTDADPHGLEAELFEFGGVFDAGSKAGFSHAP